jgi:hypothetical protein
LAPLMVSLVATRAWRPGAVVAVCYLLAAAALVVAAVVPVAMVFVAAVLVAIPLLTMSTPLVTAAWRAATGDRARGRAFATVSLQSTTLILPLLALAAWYLDRFGIAGYPLVLVVMALLLVVAARASWGWGVADAGYSAVNPIARLSLLWRNPLFGGISAAWMLLGLGNLATLPLRVEYLADLGSSPGRILLLTLIVPQAVHLATTWVWGRLFDAYAFLPVRIAINLAFLLSLWCFFQPQPWAQWIGAAAFGVGTGGGVVAWNLWVTRYTTPERTADMMAVHTFLTGIRGLGGPIAAYAMIAAWGIAGVVDLAMAAILVASGMLLVLRRWDRPRTLL